MSEEDIERRHRETLKAIRMAGNGGYTDPRDTPMEDAFERLPELAKDIIFAALILFVIFLLLVFFG